MASVSKKVFSDQHLGARDAHCNELNHYLRAFYSEQSYKNTFFVFVLAFPLSHVEIAFVFFTGLFLRQSVSHYTVMSLL